MNLILEKGHSRVPVYYEECTNIIGLILVDCLPLFLCLIMRNDYVQNCQGSLLIINVKVP
jgi:Mg2+/Co2+ transporter CorC